jgi:hypothetical protein
LSFAKLCVDPLSRHRVEDPSVGGDKPPDHTRQCPGTQYPMLSTSASDTEAIRSYSARSSIGSRAP